MLGLDLLAAAPSMMAHVDSPVCVVRRAPVISVTPESREIRFDMSQTTAQLTALQSDTVSPYAPGTVTVTDGIRRDRPVTSIKITQNVEQDPVRSIFCMTYNTIEVNIKLQPVIYIAREVAPGPCRNAVIEHEKKHVRVDREIVNDFSQRIGYAVQAAVNEIGAVGPLNMGGEKNAQKAMNEHISNAVKSLELPMFTEMRRRQAEVDSLQEYERVNRICGSSR